MPMWGLDKLHLTAQGPNLGNYKGKGRGLCKSNEYCEKFVSNRFRHRMKKNHLIAMDFRHNTKKNPPTATE